MSDPTLPPSAMPPSDLPMQPRPVRLWFWGLVGCFIFVVIALVVILNVYNSLMMLNSEKLDAARMRWRDANIKDYNLLVTVRGKTEANYAIEVRDGEVTDGCLLNGEPLPREKAQAWTVESLLDEVLRRELENQKLPEGANCFSQVEFDDKYGYPRHYLRSLDGNTTSFQARLTTDLSKPLDAGTAPRMGGAGASVRRRPSPPGTAGQSARPSSSAPGQSAPAPTASAPQ